MFYWKVTPKQFPNPTGLVPRTVIAITMQPQNDTVGLGLPDPNVNFLLTLFDSEGIVFWSKPFSKQTIIENFIAGNLPVEQAEATWGAVVAGLLRGDDATKYTVATSLATQYGYELLPIENQTGLLFDPAEEEPQPTE